MQKQKKCLCTGLAMRIRHRVCFTISYVKSSLSGSGEMVNTIQGKIFLIDHTNLRETSPVSICAKKKKLQCLFYDLGYILLPTFCVIDWHDGGLYIQMELSNLQKVKNLSLSMKFKFKVQPTMSIQGLLQPFFIVYELSVSVHMARTLDNDNSVFAIPCTRGCVTQPLDNITNWK